MKNGSIDILHGKEYGSQLLTAVEALNNSRTQLRKLLKIASRNISEEDFSKMEVKFGCKNLTDGEIQGDGVFLYFLMHTLANENNGQLFTETIDDFCEMIQKHVS